MALIIKLDLGGFTLANKEKLIATVYPEDATDKTISWSSSNEAIATVDSDGTVSALIAGTATVTAKTMNDKADTCVVDVVIPIIEPSSISLDKSLIRISIDMTEQITATLTPDDITEGYDTIIWQSSNPEIAYVDSNGLVTGVAAGEAIISATTVNNMIATCNVEVKEPVSFDYLDTYKSTTFITRNKVDVDGYIDIDTQTPNEDYMNYLSADIMLNGNDRWQVEVEITLDDTSGNIYLFGNDENESDSRIYFTYENTDKTLQAKYVYQNSAGDLFTLNDVQPNTRHNIKMICKGNDKLIGILDDTESTTADITYSAENTTHTLYNNKVIGVSFDGEAVLGSVPVLWHMLHIDAYVVEPVSISVSPESASILIDTTVQLGVTFVPEDTTETNITWTSSDDAIATVDENGLVTGVAIGNAIITATTDNGMTDTSNIEVTAPKTFDYIDEISNTQLATSKLVDPVTGYLTTPGHNSSYPSTIDQYDILDKPLMLRATDVWMVETEIIMNTNDVLDKEAYLLGPIAAEYDKSEGSENYSASLKANDTGVQNFNASIYKLKEIPLAKDVSYNIVVKCNGLGSLFTSVNGDEYTEYVLNISSANPMKNIIVGSAIGFQQSADGAIVNTSSVTFKYLHVKRYDAPVPYEIFSNTVNGYTGGLTKIAGWNSENEAIDTSLYTSAEYSAVTSFSFPTNTTIGSFTMEFDIIPKADSIDTYLLGSKHATYKGNLHLTDTQLLLQSNNGTIVELLTFDKPTVVAGQQMHFVFTKRLITITNQDYKLWLNGELLASTSVKTLEFFTADVFGAYFNLAEIITSSATYIKFIKMYDGVNEPDTENVPFDYIDELKGTSMTTYNNINADGYYILPINNSIGGIPASDYNSLNKKLVLTGDDEWELETEVILHSGGTSPYIHLIGPNEDEYSNAVDDNYYGYLSVVKGNKIELSNGNLTTLYSYDFAYDTPYKILIRYTGDGIIHTSINDSEFNDVTLTFHADNTSKNMINGSLFGGVVNASNQVIANGTATIKYLHIKELAPPNKFDYIDEVYGTQILNKYTPYINEDGDLVCNESTKDLNKLLVNNGAPQINMTNENSWSMRYGITMNQMPLSSTYIPIVSRKSINTGLMMYYDVERGAITRIVSQSGSDWLFYSNIDDLLFTTDEKYDFEIRHNKENNSLIILVNGVDYYYSDAPTFTTFTQVKYIGARLATASSADTVASADYLMHYFHIKELEFIDVTGVQISEESATLEPGNTLQLTANVLPVTASDLSITWSSSNEDIATVSSDGLVTCIAIGEVTITATSSNDKSASCAIEVIEPIPFDYKNELNNTDYTALAQAPNRDITGALVMTTASNTSSDGSKTAYLSTAIDMTNDNSWEIDVDFSISEYPATGFVYLPVMKDNLSGTSSLSYQVELNNQTGVGYCRFRYRYSTSSNTTASLQFEFTPMSLVAGEVYNIKLINHKDITNKYFVSFNGADEYASTTVQATKVGFIGMKYLGMSYYSGTLAVAPEGSKIHKLNINKVYDPEIIQIQYEGHPVVDIDGTKQFTAHILPENAENKAGEWVTSNTSIATVDANGLVTGVSTGTCNLTFTTWNGKTNTISIEVGKMLTSMSLVEHEVAIGTSFTKQLELDAEPEDFTTTLTWVSDNTDAVTVDSNGFITAIAEGVANITVTSANGFTDTCVVTVSETMPESITMNPKTYIYPVKTVGATFKLSATVLPAEAANKTITWSISDETIATIDSDGKIYTSIDKGGVVTVTATTHNGLSDTCEVTIVVFDYVDEIDGTTMANVPTLQNDGSMQIITGNGASSNKAFISGTRNEYKYDRTIPWEIEFESQIEKSTSAQKGVYIDEMFEYHNIYVSTPKKYTQDIRILSNQTVNLESSLLPDVASRIKYKIQNVDENFYYLHVNDKLLGKFVWANSSNYTKYYIGARSSTSTSYMGNGYLYNYHIRRWDDRLLFHDNEYVYLNTTRQIIPLECTGDNLTFTSSDESIATIDTDGNVTGIALGNCVITVIMDEQFETTYILNVIEPVEFDYIDEINNTIITRKGNISGGSFATTNYSNPPFVDNGSLIRMGDDFEITIDFNGLSNSAKVSKACRMSNTDTTVNRQANSLDVTSNNTNSGRLSIALISSDNIFDFYTNSSPRTLIVRHFKDDNFMTVIGDTTTTVDITSDVYKRRCILFYALGCRYYNDYAASGSSSVYSGNITKIHIKRPRHEILPESITLNKHRLDLTLD